MWCYLLSYDPGAVTPTALLEDLEELPEEIVNWVAPYPGAVFVVTQRTARELAKLLRDETALHGERFAVFDTAADRSGWLPKSIWTMLHDYDE